MIPAAIAVKDVSQLAGAAAGLGDVIKGVAQPQSATASPHARRQFTGDAVGLARDMTAPSVSRRLQAA